MFVLGERDYKGCEAAHKVNGYNYKHTLSIMHTMLRLSVKSLRSFRQSVSAGVRVRESVFIFPRISLGAWGLLNSWDPLNSLGAIQLESARRTWLLGNDG